MKLNCDEATAICDKSQYGEASFWEKIRLNIHVMLCNKCGLYSKQNDIMTQCYKKHTDEKHKDENSLNEIEKESMHKEVKSKM